MTPDIKEQYRQDLFDDFLPFMERYVIDHQYGGFMCNADRDGTRLGSDKDSWYEGRGIWVYSFLYRNFTQDPHHLEIARKTIDSVLRIRPRDGALWPRRFTRTGEALAEDGEIYGTMFIAEGLAEYSQAAREPHYWDLAKEIMLGCIEFYERPDYTTNTRHYLGPDAPLFPGSRVQGAPMVFLRLSTQMLRMRPDPVLEQIALDSVQAIMDRHYNPAYRLNNEFLNHDYTFPTNSYSHFVYPGHTIEIMWMVMDEALRSGDQALFDLAAERFERNMEVAWDDVYGGVLLGMRNVDRNDWLFDKVLWAQEEALVGTMLLTEHRGGAWDRRWFYRLFTYVQEHFPMRRHGLPLWITAADRKVTFEPHYNRIENYHHPRHLMMNLLAMERMLK